MSNSQNIKGLHVLTDRDMVKPRSLIKVIKQVVKGGVSVIQLRDKEVNDNDMIVLGKQIKKLIKGKIPLIVNDRVNVALAIEAEGIHVGQKDMSAINVRKLIDKDMILGVSANTVDQARKAEQDGANYIGAGPVYPTPSKKDADPDIGLSGLKRIKDAVSIPVIAIGGINIENATDVAKIADGVAVISAVLKADNPKQATQELMTIINKYKKLNSEKNK